MGRNHKGQVLLKALSKKQIIYMGFSTILYVEYYRKWSYKKKAQKGLNNACLGFFAFSEFLIQLLPDGYLPFVLMAERGKERFLSPPFDKRKEVRL